MPVCARLIASVGGLPDVQQLQVSKRPPAQKKWLAEKYALYRRHSDKGSLDQFFPSLYTEYFLLWPPIPTAEDLAAAEGDIAVATSKAQGLEQIVSGDHLIE
jgi:hypothetical protein